MKDRSSFLLLALWAVFFFAISPTYAEPASQIEIIFDASRSMNEASGGATKLEVAKQALVEIANQIQPGAQVGLRIFGKTPVTGNVRESCKDSQLVLPIGSFQKEAMIANVFALAAYGQTPIGYSLELAAGDFAPGADVRKTIILISDGEESCDNDPIAVIQRLQAQGIQIVVHSVGFAVDPAAQAQLQKIAELTGGVYADAKDAGGLQAALTQVAEKAEILLGPEKKVGDNILAAGAGTRIVYSSSPEFAKLIDGKEEKTEAIYDGQEVVFSFKDNQPVLLEKFAVPIFEKYGFNPGTLELYGSLQDPNSGYSLIREIQLENQVFFGNVYQEFKIDPPAPIRYLKVLVGESAGGNTNSYHHEWVAYGKYLTEEEFAAKVQESGKRERNVLAAENGGKLIAAAKTDFQYLIDGVGTKAGKELNIRPPAEGIFGFKDGKTVVIKKIAIPIFETSPYNVKTIEFSVSETSPTGGYQKAGTFETTNLVFAGNPYQEFVFETPVRAKFLKVNILAGHGESYCKVYEVQAVGTLED